MSDGGHLGFWALHVSKMCNPRFLFRSYPNKVKSIIISLWTSDSDRKSTPDYSITKDSIASQRYATPRDYAVNNVTLRKWRHPTKCVLNYDNKGSNYRD